MICAIYSPICKQLWFLRSFWIKVNFRRHFQAITRSKSSNWYIFTFNSRLKQKCIKNPKKVEITFTVCTFKCFFPNLFWMFANWTFHCANHQFWWITYKRCNKNPPYSWFNICHFALRHPAWAPVSLALSRSPCLKRSQAVFIFFSFFKAPTK